MVTNHERVCPVEKAGSLDNIFRRWLQNPLKILAPYIHEGMVAIDVGCGPGFFTLPMAQLVGRTGLVIGVDLQEGMLEKIRRKIRMTECEGRIALHKCEGNSIGVVEQADFVFLFYMVHEVLNKDAFFTEIAGILKPMGKVLIVEPPFHVSKTTFESTLRTAEEAGFKHSRGPRILLGRTAILQKVRSGSRGGVLPRLPRPPACGSAPGGSKRSPGHSWAVKVNPQLFDRQQPLILRRQGFIA